MAVIHELLLVDESNGEPIEGARVTVHQSDDPVTCTSDSVGIARIELGEKPRHLGIWIKKEGFVPNLIAWRLDELRSELPPTFTLKMQRGTTISGIVRNQDGDLVKGATVLIWLRNGGQESAKPAIYSDITEAPVMTDAEGRWSYHAAPSDISNLWVRLDHPDYISRVHINNPPPASEFRAGTAELTLIRGTECAGTVTDSEGRPLQGVLVVLGEGDEDSTSKPVRFTDELGRYRFGGVPQDNHGRPSIVSFNSDGFGPQLFELKPSSVAIQLDAVLRPGKQLRVRFVDEEGKPQAGVRFAMSDWLGHRPFRCCFVSDAQGMVEWSNAPDSQVSFWILKEGFERDERSFVAGGEMETVALKRPSSISGAVIDARTRQPVPKFQLIRGRYFPNRPNANFWNHAWVYDFTGGRYQSSIGEKSILRNRDHSISDEGFRRIQIIAPGYRAAISRPIANDETDVVCDFELEPAGAIEGRVCSAAGVPVANAQLAIFGEEHSVIITDGVISRSRCQLFSTDANGRYSLPPQAEPANIFLAHPDAGYAKTDFEKISSVPEIALIPWGRIELRTSSAKEIEYRWHQFYRRDVDDRHLHFSMRQIFAGDDLLVFEHVPSTPMQLCHSDSSVFATDPTIIVAPGETLRIDLRTGRRSVKGKIMLPREGVSVDWLLAKCQVNRKNSPQSERRETTFRIDFGGSFRIPDLSLGTYQLSAIFYRSMPEGAPGVPDLAGVAYKDFDLAEGEGDFDLGEIPWISPDKVRVSIH